MSVTRVLLGTLAAAAMLPGAQAATAWDEGASGDFANLGATPTPISLGLGSNLIIGSTGRSGAGVVDRDYFTFTLPAGWQLDTITVMPGTVSIGPSTISFIAVEAGTQVLTNPTGGSAAQLLGWWHYGPNDIGSDILGVIGLGPGAIGFTGSLPAGSYSFWIQETATGSAPYVLDFGVSAVPEPAAALMLAAGLAAIGLGRRRTRGA
jgi:hypothetical protein